MGLILLCFAFVFSCIAAGIPAGIVWNRIHIGWLAFAFFIASLIFGSVGHLLH